MPLPRSRPARLLAGLLLVPALAAAVRPAGPRTADRPTWTFPESPIARAWAGVGPGTEPVATGPLAEEPAARWAAWRADVAAEAAAPHPDAARRARLARLARAQGRHQDAWDHAAACLAEPGRLAGVVPLLLPGAVVADPLAPLPDGTLLAPSLPPRNEADPWGRSTMAVEELAVGAARLDLRVTLDPDGIQVEVTHAGGDAARCRVALPEPDAQAIRLVYVDWFRQEDAAGPFVLELAPGDEPRVLFGRFAPRPAPWTSELPVQRTARLDRDGVRIEAFALSAEARAELDGLAPALAELLAARVELRTDPLDPRVPFPGLRVRLEPGSWRRELAAIVSSTERFVLRAAPSDPAGERDGEAAQGEPDGSGAR